MCGRHFAVFRHPLFGLIHDALVEGQIEEQMKKGGLKDEEALKRELEKTKLIMNIKEPTNVIKFKKLF